MNTKVDYIGYVKYEGLPVQSGSFDARKSAKALLGFDEALRHFITDQVPQLKDADFEIPVSIQKGSWLAAIPIDILTLFKLGMGVVATAYFTKAAGKMAEKDFADFGITDIFKNALLAMVWSAKIAKHLGGFIQKGFENVKFKDNAELIGIPNKEGVYLYIPRKYYEMYTRTNPLILEKLVSNVDANLNLSIVVENQGQDIKESIQIAEKYIFTEDETDSPDEILFPDLIHGQVVSLEGEVTRENKTSNSMGFKYKEHILSAYPDTGNILPFKQMLFDQCILEGIVDRKDEFGNITAKRPKLIFSQLKPIEENKKLF